MEEEGDVVERVGPRLRLVIADIIRISSSTSANTAGFHHHHPFKKDCTDLGRRISLISHLIDEVVVESEPSDLGSCFSDLFTALLASKRLLLHASSFDPNDDGACKRITFQLQCVTWKLEKALGNIPYDELRVSDDVREQVELVRTQLKRATEKYGPFSSSKLNRATSLPLMTDLELPQSRPLESLRGNIENDGEEVILKIKNGMQEGNSSHEKQEEKSKSDPVVIPEDFLCPISLEIMRDPVIVATGQTYERSYIQRWMDSGHLTCPKTQQKLENFTLTPNYVLRSLISQWCAEHNVEQPTILVTGKLKKSNGSFCDVTGDIAATQTLVRNLSSTSIEDRRVAVTEIRSLSKRSTENRILIAEAGAIPVLVKLLTTNDVLTQENAVTSILNLSIHEPNKELIMLSGAIPSIVQVLRNGTMEARENSAATLFSLSLTNENKIIIGASGAILALVELLQNGSLRGKKDAATALFNLCIYHGNKGRAVRAGILTPLVKMLKDSNGTMVDEALTILSVLANHQEAKVAIVQACTIPVLIDLLRTGQPRNRENSAAILLALCKRDMENLASLSRLGGVIPLTEITKSGTERAKRKATSLLELLKKLHQNH